MKKLLWAVMLACASTAFASNSTVTGTVTDTDGQVWFGGTYQAVLTVQGSTGSQQIPTVGGSVVPSTVSGKLDASGAFTATLTDTSTVDQANAKWTLTICPQASVSSLASACPSYVVRVVGGSVNLTSALSSVTAPRFAAGSFSYGYLDAEVITPQVPGVTYYNLTSGLKVWTGTAWVAVAGSIAGLGVNQIPVSTSATTLGPSQTYDAGGNFVYAGNQSFQVQATNITVGDGHYVKPGKTTIGSLGSASGAGVGAMMIVTDSNTSTPGTCTAGGSTVMIALSNGTTWVCR
jgi:hypothetical protein